MNVAGRALLACISVTRGFQGQSDRPDLRSMVSSGLFKLCLEAVSAFAASGLPGLEDTNTDTLINALKILSLCREQPGCEAMIRGIAPALAFCLEHDLDDVGALGRTTSAQAAEVCCSVFGRDEGGSDFTFTQQHLDMLLAQWSQIVRAHHHRAMTKPSPDRIMVVDLCVSDANKPLLLAHEGFIPYL
eukprot:COSAG01_NODE_28807_length_652_cov_1.030741_1_plen_187_part_01